MKPSLSILIPTVGRPTLARTLRSLRVQDLWDDDEVILVADGPSAEAAELWDQFHLPGRYLETRSRLGWWGHAARNWVMKRHKPRGDYLLSIDDDDEYRPGAIHQLRRALAAAAEPWPHVFRMEVVPQRRVLWAEPAVRVGNVSTQMLAVPNSPGRLGSWGLRYEGDFDFLASTLGHYPGGPVWRPEVVANVWPARERPAG